MAAVSLGDVVKRFDAVTAVDHVSLDVADGEFVVLLGPSGCGKSTALRLIAGLERPDQGTVSIAGRVVNDVAPKDRDAAMVFQSYALYPHKTAFENMEYPLKTRRVPKDERRRRVLEVSDLLDLGDVLQRKPGQMSGGQRQRVALGRAIVRRPAVFLMDEPLSNLDAKLRHETRAELIGLQARFQATIVYVTHDQVEAMTMGSRVAVIDRGRLQQVGSPQEVYARPANTFVARFIGSPPMNLFPPGVLEPSPSIVGVRPEHLRVQADGGDDIAAVRGHVTLVESLGYERHVSCRLSDGTAAIARVSADEPSPIEGDEVVLRAEPRFRHRFDPATGERQEP